MIELIHKLYTCSVNNAKETPLGNKIIRFTIQIKNQQLARQKREPFLSQQEQKLSQPLSLYIQPQ